MADDNAMAPPRRNAMDGYNQELIDALMNPPKREPWAWTKSMPTLAEFLRQGLQYAPLGFAARLPSAPMAGPTPPLGEGGMRNALTGGQRYPDYRYQGNYGGANSNRARGAAEDPYTRLANEWEQMSIPTPYEQALARQSQPSLSPVRDAMAPGGAAPLRFFKGMREDPGPAAQSEARGTYLTTDPKYAEQYGKVSEFTVNARPEQFLEWEGAVPSNLRDLAEQHGLEPQATPRTLYRKMAQRIGEEEANTLLRSRGYEGIRYSDYSRSEPIENYVVFDRSKAEPKSQ